MKRKAIVLTFFLIAGAVSVMAQTFARYKECALTQITPKGWLKEFLVRQKDGMTGHPEALSYPYNTCLWAGEIARKNENPVAQDWWRYEQTAYYTDGLLRLGYLLKDKAMIDRGESGITYTIAHAAPNGKLGNPKIESLWPMVVFFRAMKAYYESGNHPEAVAALEKHYLSLTPSDLTNGSRHILNIEGILRIYGKTGNKALLALAEKAYDAGGFELDAVQAASKEPLHLHGVTYCEMLKVPLLLYAYTGKQRYLDLALNAERQFEKYNMLPDGVPTSAEHVGGNDIDIAHETCDISDFTWSLEQFLTVTGDARWADRIERAVFNAGLGAVTKDFRSLQYFSSVNQLIATGTSDNNAFKRGKTWMQYRPTHETECCAGNVHRFMPNFASYLWLKSGENGVTAAMYAPSSFTTTVNGQPLTVTETTDYPFDGSISFTFSLKKSTTFPFRFRIPGWAKGAVVRVNGKTLARKYTSQSFAEIKRKFRDGDRIELVFDMTPRVVTIEDQGIYVERGPLLFSYAIPQTKVEDDVDYPNLNGKKSANPDFKSWSITPKGAFNYGVVPQRLTAKDVKVYVDENKLKHAYPFDLKDTPVRITIPVRRLQWALEEGVRNPNLPAPGSPALSDRSEEISLVPYGCIELRLTVFPILGTSADH